MTAVLRVPAAADAEVDRRPDPMLPALAVPPRHASPRTDKHQEAPAAGELATAAELTGDEQPTLITPSSVAAAMMKDKYVDSNDDSAMS